MNHMGDAGRKPPPTNRTLAVCARAAETIDRMGRLAVGAVARQRGRLGLTIQH